MDFQQIAELRNKALRVHETLNNPKYRTLTIRRAILELGETIPTITEETITEKVKVIAITPKMQSYFLSNGMLNLSKDDFAVTNIPRKYSREYLTGNIDYYIIEGNIKAALVHLDDSKALHWTLILRRLMDRDIR